MNRVTSLLIGVSGADRRILAQAPQDVVKQASMGGAILSTSFMAALAAAVALRTAMHSSWFVVLVGALVWGVIILNFDRWLATSPRLDRWWKTIGMALPRLAFALVIGAVVSTPLTLQVFRSEVEAELLTMHQEADAAFERSLAEDPRFAAIAGQREQIVGLERAIAQGGAPDAVLTNPEVVLAQRNYDQVDARFTRAEAAVVCEREGRCGSGRIGAGPAYAEKVALRNRLADEREGAEAELAATAARVRQTVSEQAGQTRRDQQAQLDQLRARVDAAQAGRDREVAAHGRAVDAADGLLARIEALDRLQSREPALARAHWLLFGFLTFLECMPLLYKTLQSLGRPSMYEFLVLEADRNQRHELALRGDISRHAAEEQAHSERWTAQARSRARLRAELQAADSRPARLRYVGPEPPASPSDSAEPPRSA
jgi:hypothetical protein